MNEQAILDIIIVTFLKEFYKCKYCEHWKPAEKGPWGKCSEKKGGTYYSTKFKTTLHYMTETQSFQNCKHFVFSDDSYILFTQVVKEKIYLL